MTDLPSGIEKEVCEDIASRQRYGLGKYPTTVEENPSPLDKAIYLKKAIKILRHENYYPTPTPTSTTPEGGTPP